MINPRLVLAQILIVCTLPFCGQGDLDTSPTESSPTLSRTDSALALLDSLSKPRVVREEKEIIKFLPGEERIKTVTRVETVFVDREVVADAVVRPSYAPSVDTVYIKEIQTSEVVAQVPPKRRRALIQIVKRVVDTVYVRDTVYIAK